MIYFLLVLGLVASAVGYSLYIEYLKRKQEEEEVFRW